MDPISVVVRRGDIVEAVHRVHAVAVQDGAVVAEAGDGQLRCYFRSSAKPIQALELVRERPDLEDADVAVACASHKAEPAQIDAVRRLLEKAEAQPSDLECGPQQGRPPEPLYHNCSGKHAGFLAVCRARGWPFEGYRLPEHPLQRRLLEDVARAADVDAADVATAIDGCAAVTFALPLERMAFAFSRLERTAEGARVASAMRARPELVGGEDAADTCLMQERPGWVAKRGAEGLFCAVSQDGLAIALKSDDGSSRPLRPALARFLRLIEEPLEEFARVPCRNSRGEVVGQIAAD